MSEILCCSNSTFYHCHSSLIPREPEPFAIASHKRIRSDRVSSGPRQILCTIDWLTTETYFDQPSQQLSAMASRWTASHDNMEINLQSYMQHLQQIRGQTEQSAGSTFHLCAFRDSCCVQER